MTRWRRQLPVHSPLSAAALLAGFRAIATRNGGVERAHERVVALLKERYAARAVLLTDSGTSALTAALLGPLPAHAAGRAAEPALTRVALPAYSCYDVATAAEGAGVQVLLYDLEPHSLTPDLTHVESALRRGARAIVVAHLYGCPVDLAEVNRLAANAGAIVIEDAAQGAGATVHGRPAGRQASVGVLSFGRGKGLTGGSGGALLAFDEVGEAIVHRVQSEGRLGKARRGWPELAAVMAQWVFQHPELYAIPTALPILHLGQTIYRPPRPLRGPAAVSTSVIAASWALGEPEAQIRRHNAERLLVELRRHSAFRPMNVPSDTRAGYLRLPVLGSTEVRHAVGERAARSLGVTAGYPEPLCDLEPFGRRCLNRDDAFPGSRILATRLCTFPTHGRLRTNDLTGLEQWIREWGPYGDA